MPLSVQLPATSANLGPGFDCLGLALDIYLRVTCITSKRGLAIAAADPAISTGPDNLIYRAMQRVFAAAHQDLPGIELRIDSDIPISRGLGSSSAAIVAVLVLANELLGQPFDRRRLLDLGLPLEGHPDNLAPALFGGLTVSAAIGAGAMVVPVTLAQLPRVALFIPDLVMSTAEARRGLPDQVPRADAVFNTGRSSLLVAALAGGDWSVLRWAMEDRLHQPYRAAMFPELPRLIQTALDAGALGAALSGAGSTVIALCEREPEPIARAMASLAVPGESRVANIDMTGAQVYAQPG